MTQSIQSAIQSLLASETEKIVQEEALEASKRVEARVMSMTGQIVAKTAEWYDYRCHENVLTITVRFPKEENAPPTR